MISVKKGKHHRRHPNQQILDYFMVNAGKVVDAGQIERASGGDSAWAQRIEVLRKKFGYQIVTHEDHADLKPSQYMMLSTIRRPLFKRGISTELHNCVFARDRHTCQMCGYMPGDPDPVCGNHTIRLTIRHIIDKSNGGEDSENNLRAVCTNCNEGLQNTSLPKPDRVHLLVQIRRATMDDQRAVLDWLLQKFGLTANDR